jgi:hypothetical protein
MFGTSISESSYSRSRRRTALAALALSALAGLLAAAAPVRAYTGVTEGYVTEGNRPVSTVTSAAGLTPQVIGHGAGHLGATGYATH